MFVFKTKKLYVHFCIALELSRISLDCHLKSGTEGFQVIYKNDNYSNKILIFHYLLKFTNHNSSVRFHVWSSSCKYILD